MSGRLVIVVVWDGLRPDFVTAEVTPTLHALATGGVWFERSHCAYPSETRVNAAALATGCYPGRTGITANSFYVPGFDLGASGDMDIANTGDHTHLARIAALDPPLVRTPSTADAVIAAGGVAVVASSGSPGAAFLQAGDAAHAGHGAIILNHALLRPASLEARVLERFGTPPPDSFPATARSDWMTRGLLEHVLPDLVAPAVRAGKPALVHWWLTDPDHTAHRYGLGAPETVQSLRENDRRLVQLMDCLSGLGLAGHTDVLLTSDHGFSTAGPRRWAGATLRSAGLLDGPEDVDVVTTRQGGAITLRERASAHAPAVVRWLQAHDWVGAILVRDDGPAAGLPGTLPLSLVWNGHLPPRTRTPDIRFSTGWNADANVFGVAGSVLAGSGKGASHGSASPFDMRNSLFAWGHSFKKDAHSDVPAGIVDVAPTVRHLLRLPEVAADGRVLTEALTSGSPAPTTRIETVTAGVDGYQQEVTFARVGHTNYLVQATATRV